VAPHRTNIATGSSAATSANQFDLTTYTAVYREFLAEACINAAVMEFHYPLRGYGNVVIVR
jgi:hypothetical protein